MKKITLGMCTYDDLDGVYFTVQANRLLHPQIEKEGEIIVVDNNPTSIFGKEIKRFCKATEFVRYIPYTERRGTAVRDEIFKQAASEIVICVDCHVILLPGAVEAAHSFFAGTSKPTLLQGPMVYDSLKLESGEWLDCWRREFQGLWSPKRAIDFNSVTPFEITNMGLGAFAARRLEWPGFSALFRGFGGEEGYIHRKYIAGGGAAVSHPEFKWIHRFYRPKGPPYPTRSIDIIFNYFIGSFELNEKPDRIIEHFTPRVGSRAVRRIYEEARRVFLESPKTGT